MDRTSDRRYSHSSVSRRVDCMASPGWSTRSLVRRVVRSDRVRFGILGSAASSLGGFALAVALAHKLDGAQFGMFAIASSLYALLVGVARAAIIEPLLAVGPRVDDLRAASHRISLVGLTAGALMIALGAGLGLSYIVVTGLAAHGLTLYEFTRTVNLAMVDPFKALLQDLVWAITTVVVAVVVGFDVLTGEQGFALWASCGAIIGYVAFFSARYRVAPRWVRSRVTTTTAVQFGADFLVGSGSAALTTNAVGAVAGVTTVAALRAAGTLFGPVMLLVGVARTLTIPFLRQCREDSAGAEAAAALRIALILASLAAVPLAFVAFLPNRIGAMILGQNWPSAAPLLPYLATEALLIIATIVPFAGLRVLLAGKATLFVRSGLAVLRIASVATAAALGGPTAAAATMAAVALIGSIAWWASYLSKLLSRRQTSVLPEVGGEQ